MLSDDEIDKLIIHEYGPNADIDWHFCFARAVERAAYERAAQLREKRGLTCLWSRADDDTDVWETACRHAFTIIEGTPTDNSMAFCCYCGRPLEQEIGDSDAE